MASKTISFRLTNAEIELLEAFQVPEDDSHHQTAVRLLRELIGANTASSANTSASSAIDRETLRDEIDSRTAYLATAMNEVKSELEDEIQFLKTRVKILEQNQAEKLEYPPVTDKVRTQDITSPLIQEELEDAISPEVTEGNVLSPQARKKLSPEQLKSKSNTIAVTLEKKGLTISRDIIKAKMLELYPNPDDWKRNSDARRDVIKALEREHK